MVWNMNRCGVVNGARGGIARAAPRLVADEKGTAAIEFAMVASVFLMLLFGIMAFGFQFATRIALSYAVAEGGRAAVAGIDFAEQKQLGEAAMIHALNAYSPLIDPSKAAPSVADDGVTAEGLHKLLISIGYSDTRFAILPFVPDMSDLPPVRTTFIVSDPAG